MLVTPSGMLMLARLLQPLKAPQAILATGISTLVKLLHKLKANSPMLVTLSGMLMLVKLLHRSKAKAPMLVTPSGMLMLVRPVHS